jgi:hypothetical protein
MSDIDIDLSYAVRYTVCDCERERRACDRRGRDDITKTISCELKTEDTDRITVYRITLRLRLYSKRF